MGVIKVERIISVNSEDTAYPAENLLKSDNNKKWKCKAGERQASVILQLKQDTVIDAIDVGNENSAFIEVLVGKSSSPGSEFKVLLISSLLMTVKESKDGTNPNGVRFFKKSDLTKPTAEEKWDRMKIVCSQPFNKHVQYGLSFIVLHSADSQEESGESSGSLGTFSLKEEDEDQTIAVGSWFAKRKEPPPPVPPGAAAAIRDASSPAGIALGKNKKPTPKRPKNTTPKNGVLTAKGDSSKHTPKPDPAKVRKAPPTLNMSLDDDSPADDTDADSTYSPNKDTSVLSDDDDLQTDSDTEEANKRDNKPKRTKKDSAVRKAKNGELLNGQTPKRRKTEERSVKTKLAKVERQTKPFSRLLEGVTIVISGYQNPLRGELRMKACAMGARYKADWDGSCTHLICAFVNTPKFNQVCGQGKIVKKQWVEECHNRRRRLPWRRFALDRNDEGTSSEDEIWEEGSIPTTSNTIVSGVNRRRVSSGSDTEEEIERVRARQVANKKPVTPPKAKQKTDEPKRKTPGGEQTPGDPLTDDTDIDSGSECQTKNLPLPPLPEFFSNIVFHIACDIEGDERRDLKRYITAYKGCVTEEVAGNVEYVITKLPDIAAEFGEQFDTIAVFPEWIWECSDAGKLISVNDFLL